MKFCILICITLLSISHEYSYSQDLNNGTNIVLHEKYYLKLTGIISPYLNYKPRLEISSKTAKKTPHYKVIYDFKNRITRISYHKKRFLNNGSYFGSAEVHIDYLDNQIIRKYFDHNGKPSAIERHWYGRGDSKIHKEVFQLNDLGQRVGLVFFDSTDNPVETAFGTFSFEWKTLPDGSFIQKALKKNGEINIFMDYFDFLVTRISLDKNGNVDIVENLGALGNELVNSVKKKAAYVDFEFDMYGNEVSYAFFDKDHKLVNRSDTGTFSYGYAKVLYIRKKPKNGINDGFKTYFYDHHEQPVNTSDGYGKQIDYIKNGYYQGTEYYLINGRKVIPSTIGYFKSKVSYNKYGNATGISYFDRNLKLMNNLLSGIAKTVYIYDQNRNRIKVENFDKDGKLLE